MNDQSNPILHDTGLKKKKKVVFMMNHALFVLFF